MSAERTLLVKKLKAGAILPTRRAGDVGWDLYALETENPAPGLVRVHTGIAVELPSGFWAQLENRSSMGLKGWDVHGGIIDNHYRGEIIVILAFHGQGAPPAVEAGSKIAQLIVRKEEDAGWTLKESQVLSETERGAGGFGSTGR